MDTDSDAEAAIQLDAQLQQRNAILEQQVARIAALLELPEGPSSAQVEQAVERMKAYVTRLEAWRARAGRCFTAQHEMIRDQAEVLVRQPDVVAELSAEQRDGKSDARNDIVARAEHAIAVLEKY